MPPTNIEPICPLWDTSAPASAVITACLGGLLAGCIGTPVDSPSDPEAPASITHPAVVSFDISIAGLPPVVDGPPAGAEVPWWRDLSYSFAPDGTDEWISVDLSGEADAWPEISVPRGDHRFRVIDPCGRFLPQTTGRVSLALGERFPLDLTLQRRRAIFRGSVDVFGEPPAEMSAEVRWRVDPDVACHEATRVGPPVPIAREGRIEVEGATMLDGHPCLLVRAGAWGEFSVEIERPPGWKDGCDAAGIDPSGRDPRVVEVEPLTIRPPTAKAVAFGEDAALERSRDAVFVDEGTMCDPARTLPAGESRVQSRLIVVEGLLARGWSFANAACSEDGEDVQVRRVGIVEQDDLTRPVEPVMFDVASLPSEDGVEYLGLTPPSGCGISAALEAALSGDAAGAGGRVFRLPFCLSGRSVGAWVIFETTTGARFEAPVDVVLHRPVATSFGVRADGATPRGDLWYTRADSVRVVVENGAPDDLTVEVMPAGAGGCSAPQDAERAYPGRVEDGRLISASVPLPGRELDPDDGAYRAVRTTLCAFGRFTGGPWRSRRLDVVRVSGQPRAYFGLYTDEAADALDVCVLDRLADEARAAEAEADLDGEAGPELPPACRRDQALVEPEISVNVALGPDMPGDLAPFVEQQFRLDGFWSAPVAFDEGVFLIDLGDGSGGSAHVIRMQARDVFGQWHPLFNSGPVDADGTLLDVGYEPSPELWLRTDREPPSLRRADLARCSDCDELPRDCAEGAPCPWERVCEAHCIPDSVLGDGRRPRALVHPARAVPLLLDARDEIAADQPLCGLVDVRAERRDSPSIRRAVEIDRAGIALLMPEGDLCDLGEGPIEISAEAFDRACLPSGPDVVRLYLDSTPPRLAQEELECILPRPACRVRGPIPVVDGLGWAVPEVAGECAGRYGSTDPEPLAAVRFRLDDPGTLDVGGRLRYRVAALPDPDEPAPGLDQWTLGPRPDDCTCGEGREGNEACGRAAAFECGRNGWHCAAPGEWIQAGVHEVAINGWDQTPATDICAEELSSLDVLLWVEVEDAAGNGARYPLGTSRGGHQRFRVFFGPEAVPPDGISLEPPSEDPRPFAEIEWCGEGAPAESESIPGDGEPAEEAKPRLNSCPLRLPGE